MMLIDTHCHFDFIQGEERREKFLADLAQKNIEIIAQTVTPSGYKKIGKVRPERVALGFHPWWMDSVKQIENEIKIFKDELFTTHYIGEIGLDFSPKILEKVSRSIQMDIFEQLLSLIVKKKKQQKEKMMLSIHAVKAIDEVIQLLEKTEIYKTNCVAIIHGFNGTNDQLMNHVRQGGYFSLSHRMLQTKKWRSYIKQVPKDRLFFETDLPKLKIESHEQLEQETAQMIEELNMLKDIFLTINHENQ